MAATGNLHVGPAMSGSALPAAAAAAVTGLVAGAIPVALFNWMNTYGPSGSTWSLRGNGALILLPIAFPLCTALGVLLLAFPLRRVTHLFPRVVWLLYPVSVIAGAFAMSWLWSALGLG
jgi:hypothetical protein